MSYGIEVQLPRPASEMAQEEIRKQVAFLSRGISGVRFSETADQVKIILDREPAPDFSQRVLDVATNIQRSLRQLSRKVMYTSSFVENAQFRGCDEIPGLQPMANGIVALEGLSLSLFRYFDRVFTQFGHEWNPTPLQTPTLIPSEVLAKCDYFRSFPHNVTFACHLVEEG
ncbi:MAG: hypothetical protein JOZ43_05470, partial [Acidobacteriales bacterium]|nr:hypothetical protein [Terriglobales bacterium]